MIKSERFSRHLLLLAALSFLAGSTPVQGAKSTKTSSATTDNPGCKACMSQAATLFASDQIKQALELLSTWSAKCPRNAQLHLLYSTILIREGKDFAAAEREAQLAVVARPDSQASHLQYGMTLINNQRYQQAATEFKTVTELNPASYEAWSALADLYKRLHQDSEASAAATRAGNLEPGTRNVRLAVLNNLKRSGNFNKAKRELQRLIKDGGFGPEFDQSLAEEALQIGAYDEAVEGASRASQAYPKSVQPLKLLTLANYLNHQYKATLESSEKLLVVSPGNADALALKALSLFALGKNKDASAAAQQAEAADASGLPLVAAGMAKSSAGDYAKALDSWKACASTGPRSSNSERLPEALAHVLQFRFYRQQGATEDAIQEARSMSQDPRFKAASAAAQALCLVEEGNKPEDAVRAEKLLKEAGETGQPQFEALLAQAALEMKSGNYDQARRTTEKATVLEPAAVEPITMLARIAEASGNADEAGRLVQKALDTMQSDPAALCMKARQLLKTGKTDEAIKLVAPLAEEPAAPAALMVLGECYEKKGQTAEAVKYYKQSLDGLGSTSGNVARSAVKRLDSQAK